MTINGPGIGVAHSFEQRRVERRDGAPQSKRSVDVHPRPGLARPRADLFGWIEGPGVDVARLHADDGVFVEHRQVIGSHPTLAVRWNGNHARAAEAQHRQRLQDRDVNFFADYNANRWSLKHSIFFNIPADTLQQSRARRSQAREVRHGGAGDEADSTARGQSEQIQSPLAYDVFDFRRDWRHHLHRRILVPGARQPVRGQRRRESAANDKSKVAAAGGCDRCGRANVIEQRKKFGGIAGMSRAMARPTLPVERYPQIPAPLFDR